MRILGIAALLELTLVAGVQVLAPPVAHGGVPRSCVWPRSDPIACPSETRLVSHEVLSSARLRELEKQERELQEVVVPVQDAERNRILEDIRDEARYPAPRR